MKVLFIAYTDFNRQTSGSQVRPVKMYEAFGRLGHDVTLICGQQNKRIQRWKTVLKFMFSKKVSFDICYVEPPSGPISNLCDHILLLYIKMKKVPLGLFYRDAYWKFAEWYNVKGVRRILIYLMQSFDLWFFKNTIDVMFFPSDTMAQLFDFKRKVALPPAGEEKFPDNKTIHNSVVYVGGTSKEYGVPLLLEVMDGVNRIKKIHLNLVCRKDEIDVVEKYMSADWLRIYHTSGDGLVELYRSSDVAIIPRLKDKYMDFAMPVKLFEYLSFGLPVIATDCYETAKFIEDNRVGIIVQDNFNDMVRGVLDFFNNIDVNQHFYKNVEESISKYHKWENRVETVIRELSNSK